MALKVAVVSLQCQYSTCSSTQHMCRYTAAIAGVVVALLRFFSNPPACVPHADCRTWFCTTENAQAVLPIVLSPPSVLLLGSTVT